MLCPGSTLLAKARRATDQKLPQAHVVYTLDKREPKSLDESAGGIALTLRPLCRQPPETL